MTFLPAMRARSPSSRLLALLARQKGLEPLTYCLEGSCSIQLSYWRKQSLLNELLLERMMGIEPTRSAWKAEVLPLNYIRLFTALLL